MDESMMEKDGLRIGQAADVGRAKEKDGMEGVESLANFNVGLTTFPGDSSRPLVIKGEGKDVDMAPPPRRRRCRHPCQYQRRLSTQKPSVPRLLLLSTGIIVLRRPRVFCRLYPRRRRPASVSYLRHCLPRQRLLAK